MTRFVIDSQTLVRVVTDTVKLPHDHRPVAPEHPSTATLEILLAHVRDVMIDEHDELTANERTPRSQFAYSVMASRRAARNFAMVHGWGGRSAVEYVAVTMLRAGTLVTGDARLAARSTDLVALDHFDDLVRR